jgi:acyl transferase domain-containing protein
MEPIAIIGIGCRFPGAQDPEAFWQLLRDGVDAITEIPSDRWDINAFYDEAVTPGKINTRWGGFLEQVDGFDAGFFGISPVEAESMDPQQRLVLEVAWEAVENAGLAPDKLAGSQTGVFLGISNSDYTKLICRNFSNITAYHNIGNLLSLHASRISYLLDLRGPSVAVDTICSSALVAVHYACQSLHSGDTDLCIVGGINLILSPEGTIGCSQARLLAPDGRCKAFDASANGYVRSEGCGLVVIKRLSDALRDRDNIQAIIKGSAVNQDGRSNGITAPNGLAQQAVIRQALKNAKVAPAQISYFETHGPGTALGDPIEVKSLKAVLMQDRLPDQPCWIGSVKTNIGHLEAAAGIAGLLKVVLSLQHQQIPASLHLKKLNPYISLEGTPFSIPTELQPWSVDKQRRLAGVSSFGIGGTNSHVILEEAPTPTVSTSSIERPLHLLTLSAQSHKSLRELVQRYEAYLNSHSEVSLADVCFTANTGRSHFDHRLAVVVESRMQLQEQLGAFATTKETVGLVSEKVSRKRPKIAFLFTGQGSQYLGMGRQLYETQPTFRQTLDRCAEILRPYLEIPLLEVLYSTTRESSPLNETAYTQPALFALEYALAELWKSWGIEPAVVLGHSVGEYVAACVAGVFSLEDGLKLIAERGRLMQALPYREDVVAVCANETRVAIASPGLIDHPAHIMQILSHHGGMASVFADEAKVRETLAFCGSRLSVAAVNGPANTVISGEKQAIEDVLKTFEKEGINSYPLAVSHAFHSPLMEPMLDEFYELAKTISYHAPQIPLVSNLTGQLLSRGQVPDANYWREHIRQPVLFASGIQSLADQGFSIFLEIGPHPILVNMAQQVLPQGEAVWLQSLQRVKSNWQSMLETLGRLYTLGMPVDWEGFDKDYDRGRIPLPTYPFNRKRYWFDSFPAAGNTTPAATKTTLIAENEQNSSILPLNNFVEIMDE